MIMMTMMTMMIIIIITIIIIMMMMTMMIIPIEVTLVGIATVLSAVHPWKADWPSYRVRVSL